MTYMEDGTLSYTNLWFIFILTGALIGVAHSPDWTSIHYDGLFLAGGAFGGALQGAYGLLLILLWHVITDVWEWLGFSKIRAPQNVTDL